MTADDTSLALGAGTLFVVAILPALVGGITNTGRNELRWAIAQSPRYVCWERSMWIVGIALLALGVALFARVLQVEGEAILSWLGLAGLLLGAVLVVVPEGYSLAMQGWLGDLVRLSVMLILLSQAALGEAILQIDQLRRWAGWAMVIWNAGWFGPLFRAKDPYYPILYYVMPLTVGVILINQVR
jgi:hypothetical protein